MEAFCDAVEDGDLGRMNACLADDVVFTSPIERVFRGKAATAAILGASMEVLTGIRYVRRITSADGRDHALVYEAQVSGRSITGCDVLHVAEDGRIADFLALVRPLSAAQELDARVRARRSQSGSAPGRP